MDYERASAIEWDVLPRVLEAETVAKLFGVRKHALVRWRSKKAGPPWFKVGTQNKIYYRRDELKQWLDDVLFHGGDKDALQPGEQTKSRAAYKAFRR